MKVLILHPDLRDSGGVAGYYRKLQGRFSMPVERLIIGTRPGESGSSQTAVRLLHDLLLFIRKASRGECAIVHVNPSLDPKSLLRDGAFVLIAKLLRKKALVFFRGWHASCEDLVQNRWRWLFDTVFGRADAFIVLSDAFRVRLRSWLGRKPIFLESAVLDDEALQGFQMEETLKQRLKSTPRRVLFISRLIKEKGLYEAIDAVGLLARQRLDVELVVAGDGPELEPARRYAQAAGYANIRFTGYVRGDAKAQLLREAYLLCFPTYGEGMPNTVIECMGFGLPIITRPVGGLVDFFENGVHGYATASKDPQVFARLIRSLVENEAEYRTMAVNNYRFAGNRFQASQAAARLERIYKSMLASTAGQTGSLGQRPICENPSLKGC